MAQIYTLTFRGTVLSSNWACVTHWRKTTLPDDPATPVLAQALAELGGNKFISDVLPILSDRVVLTKSIVTAYDDPVAFYEASYAESGGQSGDDMPSYVAFGFRQNRTNSDFRASTHRIPGVLEANNAEGSFVFAGGVDVAFVALSTHFFDTPITSPSLLDTPYYSFTPILIRAQETIVDPVTHAKTVNYFTPPQTSDVAVATFYGLTSQVSRKVLGL